MRRIAASGRIVRIGLGLSALAIAVPMAAQQTASPPQAQSNPDIVVQAERDAKRLAGGEWRVELGRSYRYGGTPGDISNNNRPMGKDKSWQFCMADAGVESLVRLLVGEGQTESSGTTKCSKLQITLGSGNLRALQTCNGVNVYPAPSPANAPEFGSTAGLPARPVPGRDILTITGRYDLETLKIDFDSRREPISGTANTLRDTDGRRWQIKGKRIGECPQKPSAPSE